ncbi:3040_t:CDS:2, partial [Funneliformis geosporum]
SVVFTLLNYKNMIQTLGCNVYQIDRLENQELSIRNMQHLTDHSIDLLSNLFKANNISYIEKVLR